MSSDKQPLSAAYIGQVVASVTNMTLGQKEQVAEEMFHEQRNVLGTALVATRTSSSGEVQDAALEMAMIVFRCLREDLRARGPIGEADIERFAERNANMWRFLDGERGKAFSHSVRMTIEGYPEPGLLAYVVNRLAELRVDEPQIMLAMKTMLDVCVDAKWPGAVLDTAASGKPTSVLSQTVRRSLSRQRCD